MKRKKQDRMVSVALLTATGPTGTDKYAIEINGRVIRAALRRTP